MKIKKLAKVLLFPPIAILLFLLPAATVFLIGALLLGEPDAPLTVASYVLAAYTLTVWCARIPFWVRTLQHWQTNNRYLRRWREDEQLRVRLPLYGALLWNALFAVFHLCLGIYHRTFWYCSLSGYYLSLAVMRFFLLQHARRHKPGEHLLAELKKYRACGCVFLLMNLALSLIIFFMVYWNRTFVHHEITTIALAAYTFTALGVAIVSIVKYRNDQSPVYTASKLISLAAASVSMLTLESTMLTTWGGQDDPLFYRVMLGTTGGALSLLIVAMAVFMIVQGTKKMNELKQEEYPNGTK